MLVLSSLIYVEVVQQAATERALGEHALNSMADNLLYSTLALAKLGGSVETLSTWITGITGVNLICLLLAGEYDLRGIDNDYVVSTIYVRSESWLVLSAEQFSNLRAEATYNLVGSVDYDPLFLSCFLVYGNSLVT